MEIKLESHVTPIDRGSANRAPQRARTPADSTRFHQAEQLSQALRAAPDARPEAVERAEHLIGDVNYPPRETIQRLATLMAMHLDSPTT